MLSNLSRTLFKRPTSLLTHPKFQFAYAMKDVKSLRNMTGSPLKDCVSAIEQSNGDIDEAKEILRKKGLTDANKRAGRDANQGLIAIKQEGDLLTML
jgi:translation elongation factor EF-Ts